MTLARSLALSGFVFVAAWIVGLAVLPSGPELTASAAEVTDHYRENRSAAKLQTYLIHGVAGAALIVFVAALKVPFRGRGGLNGPLVDVLIGAGVAAASVSFMQAAIGMVLGDNVADRDPTVNHMLFNLLNNADTFKLVALAVLTAATTILTFRTHFFPQWFAWLGVVLSALLILGGLSFVLNSSELYVLLIVALPALLVWVAVHSVVLVRRSE